MSSIVLSIVNLATGALVNNVCDHIANRLRHGDCTDEKCRLMIVRELDEIKSKLDGLARKDLQSSVCFLKDGLCLLNYTFEETTKNDETENELDYVDGYSDLDKEEDLPFTLEGTEEALRSQISVFNKALALSPQTFSVNSKEHLSSAKMSFEKAYSKATEAFNNEALSTTERILAAKLRVISKILQCLEEPELAMVFCKLYLQQLHELPAVRKRFAVFFRSQVKSRLHKKKRVDDIRCVVAIHYALYEYAKLFTKTGLEVLSSWPTVELRKRAFHPLLMADKVLKKMVMCGLRSPNQFPFEEINNTKCVAVNSKGDITTASKQGKSLEMFSNNGGEVVSSFCFDAEDTNGFEILALATDLDDSVYAVTRCESDGVFYYKLWMFDSNLDRVQQQVSLECLTGAGESYHSVCIAVDEKKNVYITKQDDAQVFNLDSSGKPENDFAFPGWNLVKDLKISPRGDVIASELVGKTVGIYTKEGDLKAEITMPGLHKVCGIAFDHIGNRVVVLSEVLTGCSSEYRLASYSECGRELFGCLDLPRQNETGGYQITSHPNGPLAVVHKTGAIFLRN